MRVEPGRHGRMLPGTTMRGQGGVEKQITYSRTSAADGLRAASSLPGAVSADRCPRCAEYRSAATRHTGTGIVRPSGGPKAGKKPCQRQFGGIPHRFDHPRGFPALPGETDLAGTRPASRPGTPSAGPWHTGSPQRSERFPGKAVRSAAPHTGGSRGHGEAGAHRTGHGIRSRGSRRAAGRSGVGAPSPTADVRRRSEGPPVEAPSVAAERGDTEAGYRETGTRQQETARR